MAHKKRVCLKTGPVGVNTADCRHSIAHNSKRFRSDHGRSLYRNYSDRLSRLLLTSDFDFFSSPISFCRLFRPLAIKVGGILADLPRLFKFHESRLPKIICAFRSHVTHSCFAEFIDLLLGRLTVRGLTFQRTTIDSRFVNQC